VLIGIPRESKAGETLVAATAKKATQLTQLGNDVVVETGAGEAAEQFDSAFAESGIRVSTSPRPALAPALPRARPSRRSWTARSSRRWMMLAAP